MKKMPLVLLALLISILILSAVDGNSQPQSKIDRTQYISDILDENENYVLTYLNTEGDKIISREEFAALQGDL